MKKILRKEERVLVFAIIIFSWHHRKKRSFSHGCIESRLSQQSSREDGIILASSPPQSNFSLYIIIYI
uniref:Uncharacterized protein n=1 Tax=Nelumbo nucifera TaxID=4432 RepID=A0A822XGV7_NELNU|nr:TPA_asm: hypothetical protein HUJ06_019722 [Nelumbo nucifera]